MIRRLRLRARAMSMRARARLWAALYGVEVGRRVRVGRRCRLLLDPAARLVLHDGCTLDDGVTLAVYGNGRIELGPGSFVGHHSTLAAHRSVVVGTGAFLGELVSVRDHDHASSLPPSSGHVAVTPVEIGHHVWLAAKVTVLRGARIGDRTVVGANAVVRGDLPERVVAVGVPARVIRR